ncbi:MAG: UbiA family prenyltransferase [Bacteroidales bacterium]|nr:UbiA family prenyltransferase [Bacteroidales bacterium]
MTKVLKYCSAFWHLFRVNNLIIIILTVSLLQYFLIVPILNNYGYDNCFSTMEWICFVAGIVLIAAGGNCINDCMDITSDVVNKKKHKVIGQTISYNKGMIIYYIITISGLLFAIIPSYGKNMPWIFICFLLCALLLWQYSTLWKKKILVGNFIIALLSSFVVLFLFLIPVNIFKNINEKIIQELYLFMFCYGGFAFLFTFIRELIKTMEDVRGDARTHCRTIAVVWGIKKTKKIALAFIAIAIIALSFITIILFVYQHFFLAIYTGLGLVGPTCLLFYETSIIKNSKTCHTPSLLSKIIMLLGILSAVFVYRYIFLS